MMQLVQKNLFVIVKFTLMRVMICILNVQKVKLMISTFLKKYGRTTFIE